jgi:hypothetical protein
VIGGGGEDDDVVDGHDDVPIMSNLGGGSTKSLLWRNWLLLTKTCSGVLSKRQSSVNRYDASHPTTATLSSIAEGFNQHIINASAQILYAGVTKSSQMFFKFLGHSI